jgi:RES domain-containing protein
MGFAKAQFMEEQERGWSSPDTNVCERCVEDSFLKHVIRDAAVAHECDYCGKRSKKAIAAPIDEILGPIAQTLFAHFADPSSAGVPRDDGEWVGDLVDTWDALETLELECHDKLVEDIVGSFHNSGWYQCAGGFWLDVHRHVQLRFGWQSFVAEVQHRNRYFFFNQRSAPDHPSDGPSVPELLATIGDIVDELGLVSELNSGEQLYRARLVDGRRKLKTFAELGPPPPELATAGRMNPAGISYFYLARNPHTAISEVAKEYPCRVAVAKFRIREPMRVIDLSRLPELPSIFDAERYQLRESILFLKEFVTAISSPVAGGGREHVEYVPSQIVSEYFAVGDGGESDSYNGIVFPSAVDKGGTNVVLFPPRGSLETFEQIAVLESVCHQRVSG